jgi:hypothetical protein
MSRAIYAQNDLTPRLHAATKLPLAVTDEILIMTAESGDSPAFDELWMRHSEKAFKIGLRSGWFFICTYARILRPELSNNIFPNSPPKRQPLSSAYEDRGTNN